MYTFILYFNNSISQEYIFKSKICQHFVLHSWFSLHHKHILFPLRYKFEFTIIFRMYPQYCNNDVRTHPCIIVLGSSRIQTTTTLHQYYIHIRISPLGDLNFYSFFRYYYYTFVIYNNITAVLPGVPMSKCFLYITCIQLII